jgi:hypothetical protein
VILFIFPILRFDFLDLPSGSPNSFGRLEPMLIYTIRESIELLRTFEKTRKEKEQSSSEKWILKIILQQLCCKGMLLTLQMLARELSEETLAAELMNLDDKFRAYSDRVPIIIAKEQLQVQSI